jgi:hypothetical protein
MKYNLKWDAPKVNEDGTPLTDLKGFRIYVNGIKVEDVGNVTSHIVDVPEGSNKYTVRAYDNLDNESADSDHMMFEVSVCPGPPKNLTAEKVE